MAFAVKYRTEFTDILGLDWKVEIEEDAYAGAVIPMQCSGSPLTLEFMAASDDFFDNTIKGSKADLIIESTNFQWIDLYSTEDLRLRMSIYYNTTLFWQGFVITNNYSEPYDTPKFSVIISASDGLGYLKNYLYKYKTVTEEDTYYEGRRLESQVVLDILVKIGYSSFAEYVNIYEESMVDTVNDSPFDQIRIDVDVFRDMYCYDVLDEILKKYNACIRIIAGRPTIYRPVELAGATVYGRIFTAATTKSSTTLTPAQYISRRGALNDLRDVNGGTLMVQAPAKKIIIYQDYGNKPSWIRNYKFASDRWSGGGIAVYDADEWTRSGIAAAEIYPIGIGQPVQSDGVALVGVNTYPALNHYIYQIFGTYTIVSVTDTMCFQFDYQWFNRSGSPLTFILYFRVEATAAAYGLSETDGSYANWVTPVVNMSITEAGVADGDSGWKTYKRLFTGMDYAGTYKITFFSPSDAANLLVGIKDVLFFASNDTITAKKITEFKSYGLFPKNSIFGTTYQFGINWRKRSTKIVVQDNEAVVAHVWEKINAITGIKKEVSTILGDVTKAGTGGTGLDNNIEQFTGSLMTNIRTLLQRIDDVTLVSYLDSGIANITVNGVMKTAVWNTSLAQTVTDFITVHYIDFPNVTVTSGGAGIIRFTGTAGATLTTSIVNDGINADLTGTVANTQPLTYTDVFDYSTDWNTRGGSESKELLSIIADELANQFSRPKIFLSSLPIMENNKYSLTPHVDIMGNFQDSLNQTGGNNRKFVFNKGTANIRDREWNIDLIEII